MGDAGCSACAMPTVPATAKAPRGEAIQNQPAVMPTAATTLASIKTNALRMVLRFPKKPRPLFHPAINGK
jgi:hypothetical protein